MVPYFERELPPAGGCRTSIPPPCWRWHALVSNGAGIAGRDRSWPFRICSTRSRRRPTRGTCWPTWRSTRPVPTLSGPYGYLTDNSRHWPGVGRALLGVENRRSHNDTLISPTGEPFNARYLADHCNQTAEQAWSVRKPAWLRRRVHTRSPGSITRCHHSGGAWQGTACQDNHESDAAMCRQFEAWWIAILGCPWRLEHL